MKGEKTHVEALKLGGVEEMIEHLQEQAAGRRLAAPRQEDALQRTADEKEAARLESAAAVAAWYLERKRSPKPRKSPARTDKQKADWKRERLLQRRERERRRVARKGANPPEARPDEKLPNCDEWKAQPVVGPVIYFEAVDEAAARLICGRRNLKFISKSS